MDNLTSYQSETDDSDTDEQICRSPQKSPRKISSVLKRKRRYSASDGGGSSTSVAGDEDEDEEEGEEEEEESEEVILENAKTSRQPTDEDFTFKEPRLRKKQFTFHPVLLLGGESAGCGVSRPVTVTIPEQLAASYGLYLWPSSPVLAWYLWINQHKFTDKNVLELGAGTALPGILLAKIGSRVTLSDSATLPDCVNNCREAVKMNSLEGKVEVIPLSWGLITTQMLKLKNKLNWVIGSDLFFDPEVFEKLIFTIKWLLENNPGREVKGTSTF